MPDFMPIEQARMLAEAQGVEFDPAAEAARQDAINASFNRAAKVSDATSVAVGEVVAPYFETREARAERKWAAFRNDTGF